MPARLEVAPKMTGSTSSRAPQPPKDIAPKTEQHHIRGKMTPRPQSGQSGQPIQLTPLWEHVVRTRRFPVSVDTESTFREISDRLRDPEWEVRQHALRVLVDVLPVLEQNVVDKLMVPVVPELVTNLGHPAPAVRKGALDTLRVYLCYSQEKKNMFQKILDEGFTRPDVLDNFQSNVSMGVILSVPSLLFPSAGSPRPPEGALKFAINALASRLVQVTHQEAALRSLARIREIIGPEEFNSYMVDYNANVKRDFDILCEVYRVNVHQDNQEKLKGDSKDGEIKEIVPLNKQWNTDSDSSDGTDDCADDDEDQDDILVGPMPPARVVLETEIKFDEETAITMTILEEKEKKRDLAISESDSDFDVEDAGIIQVIEDALPERRKTRRRVRFGGEIVKLRTPDSDEASVGKVEIPRTKIPLPLFPATKMPLDHRRSFSQPTSPTHSKYSKKRSLSSSPKREIYIHNALLSPKKGILTRSGSPVFVIHPVKVKKEKKKNLKKKIFDTPNRVSKNLTQLNQITEIAQADEESTTENPGTNKVDAEVTKVREELTIPAEVNKETINLVKNAVDGGQSGSTPSQQIDAENQAKDRSPAKTPTLANTPKGSPKRSSRPSSRVNFDVFPKQERNYILMELSSPERKKHADMTNALNDTRKDFSPFGEAVNDVSFGANISASKSEVALPDQSLSRIIDSISKPATQTPGNLQATMTQHFPTTMKTGRQNTSNIVLTDGQEKLPRDQNFSSNISLARNIQNSKEFVENFKGSDTAGIVDPQKIESENYSARTDIGVGKNRSFRELLTERQTMSSNGLETESESLTGSSSEGEGHSQEPSWEELGLVNQETLNDLHNKDDWRARVRGLERLASALKTSSALAAIEPRLGSLLQAVLGGERSCRIAAAGMAVARVVISGVSEDALRRRLPQLAWGLTRQGGPHAAQLARIAMLRLRPALLLDQLLQPHCLGARNGKTRENALQLLIFSLVTFPSTEFKVQTVARRVAETVGDRRKRVRQAALDTLAVLGQIYETEEVLEAGERAASGRHDCDSMKAAIRSRLARKSLPLVSADGLVVYGLQISPNVRIATGADVDWIVAGSGSLSPGSGRSRGQLIGMTARLDSASIFRSESARINNPWAERQELIAVQGVGVGPREQAFAWQVLPVQNQDDQRPTEGVAWASEGGNVSTEFSNAHAARPFYLRLQEPLSISKTPDKQTLLLTRDDLVGGRDFIGNNSEDRFIRLEEKLRKYYTSSSSSHDFIKRDTRSNGEVRSDQSNYPRIAHEYLRKQFYELCREKGRMRSNPPPQEGPGNRAESRIPILHTRERGSPMKESSNENLMRRGGGVGEAPMSGMTLNEISRRITPGSSIAADGGGFNRPEPRDNNVGYASMYQRRRRLVGSNAFQMTPDVQNQFPMPGQRYGSNQQGRKLPEHIDGETRTPRGRNEAMRDSALPEMAAINYQTTGSENRGMSHSSERRKRSQSRSQERRYDVETRTAPCTPKTSTTRDTYGTMYQRRRRLIEGNAFLALETGLSGTNYYPQQTQHYSRHPSEMTSHQRPSRASDVRRLYNEHVRESVQKLPERGQGMTEIPTVNLHEMKINRGGLLQGLDERQQRRPKSRIEENGPGKNTEARMSSTFTKPCSSYDQSQSQKKLPDSHFRDQMLRNTSWKSLEPNRENNWYSVRSLQKWPHCSCLGDKAVVDDEDYDIRRQASSRSSIYEIQSTSSRNSQYQVKRATQDINEFEDNVDRPASANSSNSNLSVNKTNQNGIHRANSDHQNSEDEIRSRSNSPGSRNSGSSTPHSQTAAFDVMPLQTVPERRNSVNSYIISLTSKRSNIPDESIAVEIEDENSSTSDIEADEQTDEQSLQDKLSHDYENHNFGDDTDDMFDSKLTRIKGSTRMPLGSSTESEFSQISPRDSSFRPNKFLKKAGDLPLSSPSFQQLAEEESIASSKQSLTSKESRETVISNHGANKILPGYEIQADETEQNVGYGYASPKSSESFVEEARDLPDEDEEPTPDDSGSMPSLGSRSFQELDRPELYSTSNSASIARSSHSHSNEQIELEDDAHTEEAIDHSNATPDSRNSKNSLRTPAKDSTPTPEPSEFSTPGKSSRNERSQSQTDLDLPNVAVSRADQSLPPGSAHPPKSQASKVPRMKPKRRVNSTISNTHATQNVTKQSEKPKAVAQLCFTQLESKDWEVIIKGLKSLSQIARQNPAQLELCGPGTLGRVLGRHVRNLRSQVSRAACLAAGDIFLAQPKGIEQEIDDIAGPLLHRTADTNKFLRADSNAALDHLIESISPHKTIAVIVNRGGMHQNAIVRATTGRLLSNIIDRIGVDQAMNLPREARDKILVTGAKLLIDGNLDARNHAKKIFRGLSHCEGFHKALTDAVPETTLRHIDKTLRTL